MLSVQYANPHRCKHLMPGECQKIYIQVLHIDHHVRYTLSTVHNDRDALFMTGLRKRFYIILSAEHVRDLRDCHQLCPLCQCRPKCFLRNLTLLIAFQVTQHCAVTRSRRLPWKQVAVVLRDAHNYFIAFVKHQITKAVCGKIQALRCISRKNNFIRSCRMNEFLHLFPCLLIFFCRRLCKVIQPAQRICIAFFVKLRHRPDHLEWFLGGCRIVQINKIRMIFENRKILADPVYVKIRAHRVVLSFCADLWHTLNF